MVELCILNNRMFFFCSANSIRLLRVVFLKWTDEQHWGLVWSLLSCKWGVLFGSPLIGSVGEQWFGNRKSSEMVGSRRRSSAVESRKSTEMVGSRRRSSAVGSRRGIKEGHLSCYYTIVKSELIYVYEGWGWHMWERKGPPAQGAGANQNACAVPKIEKGCKKGRIELTTLGSWKRGKPVLTLTACASVFRT